MRISSSVVRESVVGRIVAGLAGQRSGDHQRRSTETPARLDFAAVAPAISDSWIVQAIARVWSRLWSAVSHSRTIDGISGLLHAVSSTELESRVALVSWAVVVGAVSHLLMVLSLERYQFPSRAALIVPALVALIAFVTLVRRHDVARALRDRHSR